MAASLEERKEACGGFELDVSASRFNICKCGRPKSAHVLSSCTAATTPELQGKLRSRSLNIDSPRTTAKKAVCADFRRDLSGTSFDTCVCGFPKGAHTSAGSTSSSSPLTKGAGRELAVKLNSPRRPPVRRARKTFAELGDVEVRAIAALLDTFLPPLTEAEAFVLLSSLAIIQEDDDVDGIGGGGGEKKNSLDEAIRQGGATPEAVKLVKEAIESVPEAGELATALRLLDSRVGTLLLTGGGLGVFKSFTRSRTATREQMLLGMASSWVPFRRKAFHGLKRICLGAVVSYSSPHRTVAGIFEDDDTTTAKSKDPFDWSPYLTDTKAKALDPPDVIVVGSGCGGGVVAFYLAAAGYDVLVIEKGDAVNPKDYAPEEAEALKTLYERGGLLATKDGSVGILAGSCLGGGSTVNWACSLRTPKAVQREWAAELDFCRPVLGRISSKFDEALDAVCVRIGVQSDKVKHSPPNGALLKGCAALKVPVDVAPQNLLDGRDDPKKTFRIAYGDPYSNKQSVGATYLREACVHHGAKILAATEVLKVVRDDSSGRAAGVKLTDGTLIRAKKKAVVVAAGSIHSPCVLRRSDVPNANVGRHLRLHPVTPIGATFSKSPYTPFMIGRGPPMTTVARRFSYDEEPYGAVVEVPHCGLSLAMAAMPWLGGLRAKENLLKARSMGAFIILQRDRGEGGTVDWDSNTKEPVVHYSLDSRDAASMRGTLKLAAKILKAAGADAVQSFHLADPAEDPEECEKRPIKSNNTVSLLSAHQMGTCRMGSNPRTSVVDDEGQSWELPGLWVADASLFPTSSGVNPMLTTMALATIVAENLKKHLQKDRHDDHHLRIQRWNTQVRRNTRRRIAFLLFKAALLLVVVALVVVAFVGQWRRPACPQPGGTSSFGKKRRDGLRLSFPFIPSRK